LPAPMRRRKKARKLTATSMTSPLTTRLSAKTNNSDIRSEMAFSQCLLKVGGLGLWAPALRCCCLLFYLLLDVV
jgi:hypothetical protein